MQSALDHLIFLCSSEYEMIGGGGATNFNCLREEYSKRISRHLSTSLQTESE